MNIVHFLISKFGLIMYVIEYPIDINVIASKLMNKRKGYDLLNVREINNNIKINRILMICL